MQRAFDRANSEIDNLDHALADSFDLGLSAGHRLSKWALPDKKHRFLYNPHRSKTRVIKAMLPHDFEFFNAKTNRCYTDYKQAVQDGIENISRVRITSRVQKINRKNERAGADLIWASADIIDMINVHSNASALSTEIAAIPSNDCN